VIETSAGTAWYVFGVVASDASPPRGTYLVERGALAAVAAEVSLDEFGDDVVAERLNDRAWLEEKVRTHEDVLQAFVGVTAVVPLRFGAIYRDLGDIRRLLAERTGFFEAALERLRGHVELGVKAWFDPARVDRPPAAGGRAYLERRRGELSSARDAAAAAAEAHERLCTRAVDAVVNRPQPRELTGREERMLLNGAYLVPDGDDDFAAELARLADEHGPRGVAYELTGPWPPYNFAPEDDDA
jgi:hypothetical protein